MVCVDLFFLFSLRYRVESKTNLKSFDYPVSLHNDVIASSGVFSSNDLKKVLKIELQSNLESLDGDYQCNHAIFQKDGNTFEITEFGGTQDFSKRSSYKKNTSRELLLWVEVPTNWILENIKDKKSVRFSVSMDLTTPETTGYDTFNYLEHHISQVYDLLLVTPEDFQRYEMLEFYNNDWTISTILSILVLLSSIIIFIYFNFYFSRVDNMSNNFFRIINNIFLISLLGITIGLLFRIGYLIDNHSYFHFFNL